MQGVKIPQAEETLWKGGERAVAHIQHLQSSQRSAWDDVKPCTQRIFFKIQLGTALEVLEPSWHWLQRKIVAV